MSSPLVAGSSAQCAEANQSLIDPCIQNDQPSTPSPDAAKEPGRKRMDSATEDMNCKLKIFFPDRTYRHLLCAQRVTVAEVKRKLLSRMQLSDEYTIQLLYAALDGSNFRILFDSEYLQPEDLRREDGKTDSTTEQGSSYISNAPVNSLIDMVYLAKIVPVDKDGSGGKDKGQESSSAASGRGFLSRRKPSSDRHRRYFFQLWRVKKMLALFKKPDEVHSVIILNGSSVHAVASNDVEFLLSAWRGQLQLSHRITL
jgi:hypothetical protein